jgi:Mg2+ and Co2+ transporter CorA
MAPPNSTPHMLVLESLPGNRWELNPVVFSLNALTTLPKQCYIFLDADHYPTADGRRQKLLAHFNVPKFVANKTCFDVNGYFGSKASFDNQVVPAANHVTSHTTWFRFLLKMVKKVEKDPHDNGEEYVEEHKKKDYRWFEMSFFTRWDYPDSSQVLCVDVPPDLPSELKKLLEARPEPPDFRDPFAMHADLVDQIVVHADVSVWRVRDPVRLLEKTRMRTGAIFGPIHEMSRHAIHASEILEASIDTLKEMQHCRTAIQQRLHPDLGETYREQAKDYAQFQISLIKALKLRSDSNQERLKNEINLAFNSLARQDNSVMKSIALLTMIFLPATFISALFSTTFFNMNDDDGTWQASDKLWVYWVTTVPATIVIVVLWRVWLANSDAITRFMKQQVKSFRAQWKRLMTRRVRSQSAPEKAGQP